MIPLRGPVDPSKGLEMLRAQPTSNSMTSPASQKRTSHTQYYALSSRLPKSPYDEKANDCIPPVSWPSGTLLNKITFPMGSCKSPRTRSLPLRHGVVAFNYELLELWGRI